MKSNALRQGKTKRLFKPEILILYYALRNSQTPLYAKVPALLSLLYMLSPVDIVPDFIPFFGYLDDLVIVPLLLQLSVKLLPQQVKMDSIGKAAKHAVKLRIIAAVLLLLMVLLLAWIFIAVKRMVFG